MSTPDPPEADPKPDYAHAEDAQTQRTRVELWAIVAIVAAVLIGAFVWRAATGTRPGPQVGWNRNDTAPATPAQAVAAGAGIPARSAPPTPRPAAP